MKIQSSDRVEYEHNPLAEVICQVRFAPVPSIETDLLEPLSAEFAALGYTVTSEEQTFSLQFHFPAGATEVPAPTHAPSSKIFHFGSAKDTFKVSLSVDFVALSCLKYLSWHDFLPRLLSVHSALRKIIDVTALRFGLRYKDLIEREPLGLGDSPWSDLVAPFMLGPLARNALADGDEIVDGSINTFVTQATLQLNDCNLLLQGALLRSTSDNNLSAFIIDSDFYLESEEIQSIKTDEALKSKLDNLHTHAGSLFRRAITEKLHAALRPH